MPLKIAQALPCFRSIASGSGQWAKVMGMQILNQQCLLNAAGVPLAGRCHSVASYNACGFVGICHLRFAVPGQEQESHLMCDPRKGPDPVVSACWASVYTLLWLQLKKNHELDFPCFKIISFSNSRFFSRLRYITGLIYSEAKDRELQSSGNSTKDVPPLIVYHLKVQPECIIYMFLHVIILMIVY